MIIKLDWVDPFYGINSENIHKLRGLKYSGGTSIIMSRDVAEYLIKYKDKLDRTLIDDVSIGLLLSIQFKIIDLGKSSKFVVNEIDKNAFVFRNKSKNRYDDVHRMRKIRLQQQ